MPSVKADTMTDGDVLKLERNILKKDQRYTFSADITSFDAIKIYHGVDIYSGGYVEITNTSISTYMYKSQYSLVSSVSHGLTMNGKINVVLDIDTFGRLNVSLTTNSGSFTKENMSWGACRDLVQVESVGSDLSNVQFNWNTTEYEKDIWVFGDSWMSLGSDGWTYHLLKEKDNFSVSGYGGGISPYLYNDFVTGLKYDTPKYAVWALGMNEGDSKDSDAINSTWKEYVNYFIKKCEENHITPILVTIPSSATINNDNKNEWIRNSGYRYIDFATAMGANNFGTSWTTGLAKSDGNHPTEDGAKVLAQQVLKDFPEIE